MSYKQIMSSEEKFAFGLLGFGALTGIVLALLTLIVVGDEAPHDANVVATVDGVPITRTNLDQRMNLFMRNPNFTLPSNFESRILEALIDEELLIQEAVSRGLIQADAFTRQSLDMSVARNIFIQTQQGSVSDTDLNAYYQANKERLTPPFAVQVDRIFISKYANSYESSDETQAPEEATSSSVQALQLDQVRRAIQSGESFSDVKQRFSDPIGSELPQNLLRVDQLSQYLAPALIAAVQRMREGAISDALQTPDGWSFLHVIRKQAATPPEFADVKERIRKILEKEAVAKSRENYLTFLRATAIIKTSLGTQTVSDEADTAEDAADATPEDANENLGVSKNTNLDTETNLDENAIVAE
ncbi:peptidyl-prolyl cis-trans isomerase [Alphaproteobacteria bacterium]|nr:peptidyl-prolyl cis-trans isomerase [Alphaproteobacteria bacterium]